MDLTIKNAYEVLKKYLEKNNPDKFSHSIRVANIAVKLVKKWNDDKNLAIEAAISGLLHDIGKSKSKTQMLNFCSTHNILMYPFEVSENPTALHGIVSSMLFEEEFYNEDYDLHPNGLASKSFHAISHAISSHVAGSSNMNDLDKIIFIADNVEPFRKNDFLKKIFSGEIATPDECIRKIIEDKRKRANIKNRELNPLLDATLDALDRNSSQSRRRYRKVILNRCKIAGLHLFLLFRESTYPSNNLIIIRHIAPGIPNTPHNNTCK